MTASRYFASRSFDTEVLQMNGYLQHIQEDIRRTFGLGLVKELEAYPDGVTVKIKWIEPISEDIFRLKLALVADLLPVEKFVKQVVAYPVDQLSFTPYDGGANKVIEWQCAWCGQVNLVREHLECRKCGAPRRPMQ